MSRAAVVAVTLIGSLTLGSFVGSGAADGQERRRSVLLGVVAVEHVKKADTTVVIADVLPDTAAAAARLRAGDELLEIAGEKISKADDVTRALIAAEPGSALEIVVRRDGKKTTIEAKPTDRAKFTGDSLRPRRRGETGFEAPDWHVYAWDNVTEGETAPTRATTAGKVVAFHCFQSW